MEGSEIAKKIFYKSLINNNNEEEEDFQNQILSSKLFSRKKKLYQLLMQRRIGNNLILKEDEKKDEKQLSKVSILIHKEDFDNIQNGLNIFYDYLINNEKLDKENIDYIFENIYYRLLDIISSNKSFVENKNMSKILFLLNYLTTENNIFIRPLTEKLFLSNLKKIISININNDIFINMIIPILSNILIDKKKFVEIMNEINVTEIMKIKINQNDQNKDSIEQLLLLMNNFIMNINKEMTHKFKYILDYIINILNIKIINNINIYNDDDLLIMTSLFDILIYMANDEKNIEIIKKSNIMHLLKSFINSNTYMNINIYKLKCYELLSYILMNAKNIENKKEIIAYIYNNNLSSELPFVSELIEAIKNQNKSNIYIFLNCINSLINNCEQFCEAYCFNNSNIINILIGMFKNKITKKIKNEIIIFFINIIEINNVKICKHLLNTEIFSTIISYINKKIKTENYSTNIIIFNIIYLINKCLLIDNVNYNKEIINILNKFKFKNILEILIENKDESISDISRTIFIKYFSEPENIYSKDSINEDGMIIE